jgi:hypothetical protein
MLGYSHPWSGAVAEEPGEVLTVEIEHNVQPPVLAVLARLHCLAGLPLFVERDPGRRGDPGLSTILQFEMRRRRTLIARTWRGWIRTDRADAYVDYINSTGIKE